MNACLIPPNKAHQCKNYGSDSAVLMIKLNSKSSGVEVEHFDEASFLDSKFWLFLCWFGIRAEHRVGTESWAGAGVEHWKILGVWIGVKFIYYRLVFFSFYSSYKFSN